MDRSGDHRRIYNRCLNTKLRFERCEANQCSRFFCSCIFVITLLPSALSRLLLHPRFCCPPLLLAVACSSLWMVSSDSGLRLRPLHLEHTAMADMDLFSFPLPLVGDPSAFSTIKPRARPCPRPRPRPRCFRVFPEGGSLHVASPPPSRCLTLFPL